jgi:hypothetical protein
VRLDRARAAFGLNVPLDAALPRHRWCLEAESVGIRIVAMIAICWIFSFHVLNTFLLAFGLRRAYRIQRYEKLTYRKME